MRRPSRSIPLRLAATTRRRARSGQARIDSRSPAAWSRSISSRASPSSGSIQPRCLPSRRSVLTAAPPTGATVEVRTEGGLAGRADARAEERHPRNGRARRDRGVRGRLAPQWRCRRRAGVRLGGRPIGITLPDDEREDSRRRDSQAVVPEQRVQRAGGGGEENRRRDSATSDPSARRGFACRHRARKPADPKAPRMTIPIVSSSNFDISLMTPAMADSDVGRSNPRTDFGNWADYVNIAPPVLLVRVTPQFEESVWKTIVRGAAATQGANLPPLKSFTRELPSHARVLRRRGGCPDSPVHHRARSAGPRVHPRRALCVRGRRLRPALRNGALRSLFRKVAGPGR